MSPKDPCDKVLIPRVVGGSRTFKRWVYWEVFKVIVGMPSKGIGESWAFLCFFFLSGHEVSSFALPHVPTMLWASPQAQGKEANQSWIGSSKTVSQSKTCLFISWSLQVFYHNDEKLTNRTHTRELTSSNRKPERLGSHDPFSGHAPMP
jgi:hypothetical protein